MTARNLALEALKELVAMEGTERHEWDAVERVIPEMCSAAKRAIAALEAETGEVAAWIGHSQVTGLKFAAMPDEHRSEACAPWIPTYTTPPPAVPQWLPIETAPKTSKAILVHCAERKNTYTATWARDEEFPWSGKWKHFSGDFINEVATHWQPLPAAPGAPA